MATIHWDWGDNGYELRVSTRVTEVLFASDLPVSTMDVQIMRGLPEPPRGALATTAAPATAAAMSPHERAVEEEEVRYTYEPVQVKVHVFFQDEGTIRIHLNVNSKGEITTIRPPGVANGAHHTNCAKGIGKGVAPL